MGLDMYLNANRYLSAFNPEALETAQQIKALFPELKDMEGHFDDGNPVRTVSIDVGYWRKANAIHKWFVDNVQQGVDECQPHYVSREQLLELKSLCERVLAKPQLADELLPAQSGFFFGGTDYDEFYFEDLKHTIKVIDQAVTLPDMWDLEYRSSW